MTPRVPDSITPDWDEPNYKCPECEWQKYIDDFHRCAPSYCRTCDEIQTFKKL